MTQTCSVFRAHSVVRLPATSSRERIFLARDVFRQNHLDPRFWSGATRVAKETAEVEVPLSQLTEDITFVQMFDLRELDARALTEGQVVAFGREHSNLIITDGMVSSPTFLLYKEGESVLEDLSNIFFASLFRSLNGDLHALKYDLSYPVKWLGTKYQFQFLFLDV